MINRILTILLATLLVVGLVAGCTPTQTPKPTPTTLPAPTLLPSPAPTPTTPTPAPQGTLNLFGNDPLTLDPALASDIGTANYISQIFSGLVRFDDNLQPVPDIARSWDVSPDGKTYTFHLRNNVKFHDGRQVKAADFKFSWERAASPATRSITALTYLGDIVGVGDMLAGKASSLSGVKALDDYTLQVTIDAPKSYFPLKLTYPTSFVVDSNNVKAGQNWWLTSNGTGPFKLTSYQKGKQLVFGRNELFYGDKARVNSVVYSILSGAPMSLYETGKIDVVGISLSNIERASDSGGPFAGQLVQAPELSVTYIGFNVARPPFDDINIRQAFSYAIDKDKLVSVAYKNMMQRADGILPAGMPGYNKNLTGIGFDVSKAKDLIAKSKYGSIANLPPITLTTSGEGGGVSGYLQAIAYQWKQNLGVDVTIRALEQERYIYNLKSEVDNMFDFGWIADYPNPQDFLDILFHGGADNNYGNYSNRGFDTLLDQAAQAKDLNAGLTLYQQAEQMLVADAGALPLYFGQEYVLVKPYVKGYKPNPLGIVMLNSVTVLPH